MNLEEKAKEQGIKIDGAFKILQDNINNDEEVQYLFSGVIDNFVNKFVITDKRILCAYKILLNSGKIILDRKKLIGVSVAHDLMFSKISLELVAKTLLIKNMSKKDANKVQEILS